MKIFNFAFLFFSIFFGYSQESSTLQNIELKQKILNSKELLAWQNAMITYQDSNLEFCSLKSKLNQRINASCGTQLTNDSYKETTLSLVRTMRITDELRDSTIKKEKELRTKFPQLASHFKLDEIFPELYAPIQKAREKK